MGASIVALDLSFNFWSFCRLIYRQVLILPADLPAGGIAGVYDGKTIKSQMEAQTGNWMHLDMTWVHLDEQCTFLFNLPSEVAICRLRRRGVGFCTINIGNFELGSHCQIIKNKKSK